MEENGFTFKKKVRIIHYSTETITDEDYTDDLALLANKPT